MYVHGFTNDEYDADDNQPTLISKLDLSSPLHLHPNDSATLTVVSVKLKGTENYQVWSCAMLLALEGKNKTGFIDGSCRRSNTDEVLGRQWDRVNAVVLGWILNSISEELFLGQFFYKRAKHVWDELKETYDKVVGFVTFNLHHKINSLSQNGSFIADYYHRLNALWKQFDALVQLPRCTCHAADDFKKHNQLMKLMQFLMGLDDCYMQIRSNILSRDELPDVRSAYAIISSEESHRVVSSSGAGLRPLLAILDPPLCFKIIGYPTDFGKRNGNNNFSNQGVQNFNRRFVNNNNFVGSSSNSFSDDQISKLITLIKENSLNSTGKGVQANMAGANQHLTYTDKDLVNVIDISYLVDDYTRAVWVYMLKSKDEVFGCILVFYNLLKNQFGKSVKIFTSDNGTEFTNKTFETFYANNGIIHQTSYVYTPQHNGIVERKQILLDAVGVTVAHVLVTAAQLKLVLLKNFNGKYTKYLLPSVQTKKFDLLKWDQHNKSDSDGSNSSQDGSPTFDHQEDAEMPFYGSNGSATENEMAATPKDTNNSSEGVIGDVQHTEVENNDAQPVRRSKRSSVFPKRYNDFVVDSKVKYGLEKYVNYSKLSSETKCFVTELNKSVKPRNYWEACKDQHWVEAMNKEMDALYKNDTWDITDVPIGRKSIGGNGFIRLNINPVVKLKDIRQDMLFRVQNNWCLSQLDINNAFLYGDLFETMYMDLPEGYFSPDDKKPSATPLEQSLSITNKPTDIDNVLDNIIEYQKLIGKLIYLTHTRPDISYYVHCLSQFMHKPLRSHLRISLRVLRYLKGNPGKGVHIVRQPKASLEAFVDADWAKCLITRKSVTSFCIKLNGSLISWKSKKQHTLSNPQLRLNTRLWLQLLLRSFGFFRFLRIWSGIRCYL
ncbi:ribonuclease H-like domain-containing protein [Tanacetum coccineum]